MNNYNYCPQYLATLDELQASRHSESRRPMHFGAKLEARFDIFHFIQSDIIFGIVNPSQWKANISSPASKLNAFPVNLHWLQDSKVFPVCWILIGELLYFRFHSSLSRYIKKQDGGLSRICLCFQQRVFIWHNHIHKRSKNVWFALACTYVWVWWESSLLSCLCLCVCRQWKPGWSVFLLLFE